jgi:hypothetical protein
MSKRTLAGTVEDRTGRRYEGVLVRLAPASGDTAPTSPVSAAVTTTDDDGDFDFDLSDHQRWPEGQYVIDVFHNELSHPVRRPIVTLGADEITLESGNDPSALRLTAVAGNQVSQGIGLWFMAALIVLLGLSVSVYMHLHHRDDLRPRLSPAPPIDHDLSAMVVATLDHVRQGPLSPTSPAAGSLAATKRVFDDLVAADSTLFDQHKQVVVNTLFDQADQELAAHHEDRLSDVLARLDGALREPSDPFFWQHYPGNLVEVLFWALGATLIRHLFRTGSYLRRRRFYSNAIAQHVALIVSIPILAVLFAFLLSLIQIDLGMGDQAIRLDLSNVAISILVGAIIGLSPWAAWDFLNSLGDRLFRKLRGEDSESEAERSLDEEAV